MESLEVLRKKLDSIDDQIAALYEQRMMVMYHMNVHFVNQLSV